MKHKQVLAKVYEPERLQKAWQQVKRNAGAAGIDRMTVEESTQREEDLLAFCANMTETPEHCNIIVEGTEEKEMTNNKISGVSVMELKQGFRQEVVRPNPQVPRKPLQRWFTASYKLQVL